VRKKLLVLLALACSLVSGSLAGEPGAASAPQSYRFVLTSEKRKPIAVRGLITVDGKDRVVADAATPFEFECEAGSKISGYFEVVEDGDRMRLRVYDPEYSTRRPSVWAKKVQRIRFSWAQPGVGPRCLDPGTGACPDTVPGMDEMKKRLQSLGGMTADEPHEPTLPIP